MKIRIGEKYIGIRIEDLMQYIAIYFLFILHGAKLYTLYEMPITYGSIGVCFIFILVNKKYYHNEKVVHILFVFGSMLLLGVAHIEPYFGMAGLKLIEPLLLLFVAYSIDEYNFFRRFVIVTAFFSVVSLGFYMIQITQPSLLMSLLTHVSGWELSDFYGVLFYTYRGAYAAFRNNGIFTEPGIYQMILNAALAVMLFFPQLCRFRKKNYIIVLIVLFVTIITTGSTTGYMSLGIIILGFYINKNKGELSGNVRRIVIGMTLAVVIGLIVDSNIRGTESLLNTYVFSKFSEMQESQIASGSARVSMLMLCYNLLISNPLGIFIGCGFSALTKAITTSGIYATGAFVISFLTSVGLPLTIFVFYPYIIKPFKKKKGLVIAMVFALLWINTSLAQSRYVYPSLILLPYLLMCDSKYYDENR